MDAAFEKIHVGSIRCAIVYFAYLVQNRFSRFVSYQYYYLLVSHHGVVIGVYYESLPGTERIYPTPLWNVKLLLMVGVQRQSLSTVITTFQTNVYTCCKATIETNATVPFHGFSLIAHSDRVDGPFLSFPVLSGRVFEVQSTSLGFVLFISSLKVASTAYEHTKEVACYLSYHHSLVI